ncbi:tetratricopeptide repeat-containing S1 family peptidase [Streptomyces pseudogriseolus]|uniref:tetratricopeptide repeat-containing S1 family peptidase n=1 Tax=Streptomyces pseudogriseolus TaxID=36817 RepID=UPI003FA2A34A
MESGAGTGSGYVIAPRLLLSSAHVVPGLGERVSLFRPGQKDVWAGTVVWRGTPEGRDDAALVHIDDPAWLPPAGATARWGCLVTDRPGTPCESWGTPDVVQRSDRAVDTLHISGTLNPGDRYVGNRYVLNLTQHPPEPAADGSSPWGGMSGSALFCGDLLIGVITSDPAGRAHANLEAVPAYVLMHDPAFRTALADYAPDADTVLEPAEWQHLAEVTAPILSPGALLLAQRQVAPFRGRLAMMDDLHTWAEREGFDAWLLYGPGGQGKTRLAHHFASSLTAKGWATLWLRRTVGPEAVEALAAAAVPLLVVVDYAETRTSQVTEVLEAAARHSGGSAFKVLLLARTAGDWWRELQAASPIAEELLHGARAAALAPLEPVPGASRTEAYREAVHGYARYLPQVRSWRHHDWPTLAARLAPSGNASGTGPSLSSPDFQSALTLQMTALVDLLDLASRQPMPAAERTGTRSPAPDAQTVEDRLLLHERRYWTSRAAACGLTADLTIATLTEALAAALLFGAETRTEAEELLNRVPALKGQPADRLGAVSDWIASLYPTAAAGAWGALTPDRLAERFTGRHLQDHPDLAESLVHGTSDGQIFKFLTVYARAAAHPVFQHQLDHGLTALCVRNAALLACPAIEVATRTEAPQPLIDALEQIAKGNEILLADLKKFADRIPESSYNLAPFAARLAQSIVDRDRVLASESPDHLPDLAVSLKNLGTRLLVVWGSEQYEEVLALNREVVDIRRKVARDQSERSLVSLASDLNNLSGTLALLDRDEEALAAITEAVSIRRKFATRQTVEFLRPLATSLDNQAVILNSLGRIQEAASVIMEAVEIRRQVVLKDANRRIGLAASLHTASQILQRSGRMAEALDAVIEAKDVYEGLVEERPDAYRSNYASFLEDMAWMLWKLGLTEDALALIDECIEILDSLADGRCERHIYEDRLDGALHTQYWIANRSPEDAESGGSEDV